MKCPKCEHNHPKKLGLKCGACGYEFVFDPRSEQLTDGKWLSYVRKASAGDTLFFTRNQLYSIWAKQQTGGCGALGASLVLMAVAVVTKIGGASWVAFGFMGSVSVIFFFVALMGAGLPDATAFERVFDKWMRRRSLPRLLTKPALRKPPPEWKESDIYDYGVERILFVQHDLLVDLLVKNELHVEFRMLVLSLQAYPSYLMPVAKTLLEEREDLPIFALHDASAEGEAMVSQLKASESLPLAERTIIDMGLPREGLEKFKPLAHLKPKKMPGPVYADYMPNGALRGWLGAAFERGGSIDPSYEAGDEYVIWDAMHFG